MNVNRFPTAITEPLFLSAHDVAALVRELGVGPCIEAIAKNIFEDFSRWNAFDKSARTAAHSPDGVIELMPIADAKHYAFKYVNGHPKNVAANLPTVMAFGVLADVATGAPLLLSELTLTTAMRTAAMSALAAQHLARKNCTTMALIGNGAQSEFQAIAFQVMLGINTLRIYDIDPAASEKLARNLLPYGFEITICKGIADAVRGADIVTTITADKSNATILTPEMIVSGMHLNAVGGDCPGKTELHPEILASAKVAVEYAPQSRIEGEIQQMPRDFAVTELWEILSGQKALRKNDLEVTVFDSVGFALEDFSALRFLLKCAIEMGLGERIALIPPLQNPKDIFGFLYANTCGADLASPAHQYNLASMMAYALH